MLNVVTVGKQKQSDQTNVDVNHVALSMRGIMILVSLHHTSMVKLSINLPHKYHEGVNTNPLQNNTSHLPAWVPDNLRQVL